MGVKTHLDQSGHRVASFNAHMWLC